VKFLYNVFSESGTERFVTILTLGFGLFVLIMYLIGLLFKSFTDKLNSIIPESVKLWIRALGKILNFMSPIILGMIIYHFWNEDWIMAAIVLTVLLIQRIVEITKEEKSKTKLEN
jgi:hypothetical protein